MHSSPLFFLLAALLVGAASAFSPVSLSEDDGLVGSRSEDPFGLQEEDYEAEDGENRFLFTSTSSVTVNSTLLRAIGAIIGALLIALPLYLAYATATAGGSSGSSYNRRRYKRDEDEDLAAHMYALLETFRKYNMENGCQILMACEAGKYESKPHPKYGKLTRDVHKILSTANLAARNPETDSEISTYIDQMLSLHEEGRRRDFDCQANYAKHCPNA